MASRLELQTLLENVLGSYNVYYQPPESLLIKYPAIVYSRDSIKTNYANDNVYTIVKSYEVIVIDKDPDSLIVDKVGAIPSCKFIRNYTVDNLNHDIFTIQF